MQLLQGACAHHRFPRQAANPPSSKSAHIPHQRWGAAPSTASPLVRHATQDLGRIITAPHRAVQLLQVYLQYPEVCAFVSLSSADVRKAYVSGAFARGGGGAHLPDSASSTADTADCRAPYTRSASACCAAWTAPAAASLPPLLPCVPMYHPNCRSRAHQQQIVCCRTGQLLSSRGPKTVGHCQSAGQMAAAPPCHRALHYNIQNIVYGLSLLRQLL